MYLCSGKGQTIPLAPDNMQPDNYLFKLTRFHLGYTQREAARKAGVCLSVYIKAEQGKSISPKSNRAIRDALHLD